jgi:tripartite-type tricarboxylate transporter receptor subunit TctC
MVTRRTCLQAGAVAAGLVAAPRLTHAAFPDRPIRLMLGFAAGGTVDAVGRILAQALGPQLGQQVIVDNRPGAANSLAASVVVRAEPDGHTLLHGAFSHAVAPALVPLTYDTLSDLVGVSQIASVPLLLFAGSNTSFHNVADVVAAARARPATITFASSGPGSSAHLAAELLSRQTGVSFVHVPYRGGGQAVQALLAGDVQLLWDTPQSGTLGLVEERRLRPLAVMGPARLPAFPNVPAIGEAGLGGNLEVQAWQGILVRSGTPPDVVAALHGAITRAMHDADVRERIRAVGVEPMATESAAFTAFFRAETLRWTDIARRAGITAQ